MKHSPHILGQREAERAEHPAKAGDEDRTLRPLSPDNRVEWEMLDAHAELVEGNVGQAVEHLTLAVMASQDGPNANLNLLVNRCNRAARALG